MSLTEGCGPALAAAPAEAYIKAMTTDLQTAPVTLSPSAAARVAAIAAKQGKAAILRLSVEGGGCSGFQYKFGLAEAVDGADTVSETDGVQLVVDDVSLDLVAGCVVDYVESLGGAAFRVENPQAVAGCGCGSSFAI
ncbi:iron-sulfur cluster assembly accessory protein [Novosphingobium chloroacetimidivorans]|uniref:Iron-sulfur cluster assembly accessory protein n=2 Tax=Novosphingobium chloroacetimidivorans TaxID=1428314 RepID=A0A7W7K7Y1_9SPHN|nr:iron-sulfur cluster assembly accessory protein [Novosphingobium chloroacetimidivorans]